MLYVILSLLPFTVFVPIGYWWATYLEAGSVSFLGYSQSFSGFLSVATGMGIAIVSFPDLADDFANGNGESAMYRFEETLKYVLMISAFIAAVFIALRLPILSMFYQHGSFNTESVKKLASVLPFYLVAAIFIAGLNLLRTLFYSKGDYKKIAILGLIIPLLFFGLSGIFKNWFSFVGIGISNTISIFVLFILSVLFSRKKSKEYLYKRFFIFCFKIIVVSVISAFFTEYMYSILSLHLSGFFAIVICSILFSCIFYILGRYILKIIEVSQIVNLVYAKLQVRKK
jgi:putative peptidoglycan lipid II flippase